MHLERTAPVDATRLAYRGWRRRDSTAFSGKTLAVGGVPFHVKQPRRPRAGGASPSQVASKGNDGAFTEEMTCSSAVLVRQLGFTRRGHGRIADSAAHGPTHWWGS
ncbi:hypothetical protein ACFFX0_17145 [Citricoccus parietis]|uniref:Uncharacterized protein n=1 Tax=Citricoccus parietis TaxID=592307 RepID=A0ABV5G1M3_9MICC